MATTSEQTADVGVADLGQQPAWIRQVDQVCSALIGAPENLYDDDKCRLVYDEASAAAQEFYALLAKTEEVDGALGALENLVVDGLDLDQIWQEIDNQQKPLEKILKKKMKFLEKLNGADGIQLLPDAEAGEVSDASTASENEEDVDMASEASSALASDQEDEEGEGEQEPAEGGEKGRRGNQTVRAGPKSSAVDEGLFKLSDMNDFLEMEDKKDAEIAARHKAGKKAGDEDEDDEDEDWGEDDEFMDLEKPIGDDDSEDVDVDKLMYSDFFDAPEEGEEAAVVKPRDGEVEGSSDDDEGEDEEEAEGGLGFPEGENLEDEEEAALEQQLKEMQGDLGEEEEEEESEDEAKQAFAGEEKEQGGPSVAEDSRRSETSALKKRIADMENEIEEMEREQLDEGMAMVQEKHWTMTGEATGSSRPLNSLLEQHIDLPFSKLAARRAEKQWEEGEEDEDELTQAAPGAFKIDVDAIIRQRVADETYDDVIKRSEEEVMRLKDSQQGDDSVETLNFQKSRLGLADVYAKQYETEMLGQQTDAELQQDADRVELRKLFGKLMHKLDTLTNQNFTPRPVLDSALSKAARDGDAPAIRMEEAVPITVAAGGTEGNEVTKGPEKQKVREEMTGEEKAAVRGNRKAKRRQKAKESIEKGNVTVGDRRAREAKLIEKNKKEKAERKARKEGPTNDRAPRKIRTTALMAAAADSAGRDVRRSEAKRKEGRSDATAAGGSKRVKL